MRLTKRHTMRQMRNPLRAYKWYEGKSIIRQLNIRQRQNSEIRMTLHPLYPFTFIACGTFILILMLCAVGKVICNKPVSKNKQLQQFSFSFHFPMLPQRTICPKTKCTMDILLLIFDKLVHKNKQLQQSSFHFRFFLLLSLSLSSPVEPSSWS